MSMDQTGNQPSDGIDWIARASKRAKGKRPEYFNDQAVELLTSTTMALAAEVSVLRQRLDTVERLLDARQLVRRDDVESFVPDAQGAYERGVATKAYVARIMRGMTQAMDELAADERSVEEVIEEVRNL